MEIYKKENILSDKRNKINEARKIKKIVKGGKQVIALAAFVGLSFAWVVYINTTNSLGYLNPLS